MFCTKCGKELAEGSKFCPSCGSPVETSSTTNTETPTEETKNTIDQVKDEVTEAFVEADTVVSAVADQVVNVTNDAVKQVEEAVEGAAKQVQETVNEKKAERAEQAASQQTASQQAPQTQSAPYRQDETVVTSSYAQTVKIFAAVAGVILAWGFLRNFFGGFFSLVGLPFSLISGNFYGSFVGSLFGNLLSVLQGLSFGVIAVTLYFMFKDYKEEKQKDFAQILLSAGVVAGVIAFIRLIRYIIVSLDYWEYYEVGFRDFSWFLKSLIFAALGIVGFLVISLAFGKKFELVSPGGNFIEEAKAAFKDLFSKTTDEVGVLSEKIDQKQAEREQVTGEAGKPLHTNYSLLKFILLGMVTCGIYPLYILHCVARDTNKTCAGDGQKTRGLILYIIFTMLTCGIYSFVYFYMLGNRINAGGKRYGRDFQENGTTVLMWMLFGALLCGIGPYIAWHIILKNTNALNEAYNGANFGGPQGPQGGQPTYQPEYPGYTVAEPAQTVETTDVQ